MNCVFFYCNISSRDTSISKVIKADSLTPLLAVDQAEQSLSPKLRLTIASDIPSITTMASIAVLPAAPSSRRISVM